MSQCDIILRHMEEKGSITAAEAMSEYGIMRLASRISDLKRLDVPIVTAVEHGVNRRGEPVRYARYSLGG